MIIRASQLIKESCFAIKHKTLNNITSLVNYNMQLGEKFQQMSTPNIPNIYKEMQGIYNINKNMEIRYSNDYISKNHPEYICEVKSVFREPENWYKAICIIGAAFYKSLIIGSANQSSSNMAQLTTAPFEYERNGNIEDTIFVSKNIPYLLQFGNDIYIIDLIDSSVILSYYVKKAIASLEYDTAKEWDNEHHKKTEWISLKDYIKVTKTDLKSWIKIPYEVFSI